MRAAILPLAALVLGLTLVGLHAQSVPPQLPSPRELPAAQYFYNENGKPAGPFSAEEIRRKIASGTITADTLVWRVGAPAWVALKDDADFERIAPLATAACAGKHTLMADDFTAIPKGWQDANWSIDGRKLKVKPQPSMLEWQTYEQKLIGDIDLCLTVQIPRRFIYPQDTSAGIVFGGSDSKNFFAFMISPSGQAALFQFKGDKIAPLIDWRDMDAIRTDPGVQNKLRVAIKGGTGAFFVNGASFNTTYDALPNDGLIGVIVSSESDQRDAWKLVNLKATDLP